MSQMSLQDCHAAGLSISQAAGMIGRSPERTAEMAGKLGLSFPAKPDRERTLAYLMKKRAATENKVMRESWGEDQEPKPTRSHLFFEKINEMLDLGLGKSQIVERLGCTPQAVHYHQKRRGIV